MGVDLPIQFITKRAFRAGRVERRDVREAFGLGDVQASRWLSEAVRQIEGLRRLPRWVSVEPWAQPPAWAGANALLQSLDKGECSFRETGLRIDELPVNYVRWSEPVYISVVLEQLTTCIVRERMCAISYVGMRVGESARWRRIYPLGLERMETQWRLIAHNLETPDYRVQAYVLVRIMDVAEIREKVPKGFTPGTIADMKTKQQVVLDGRYTEDQKRVLSRELRIQDDMMELSHRSVFEFQRRFSHQAPTAEAVWPPVKIMQEKSGGGS